MAKKPLEIVAKTAPHAATSGAATAARKAVKRSPGGFGKDAAAMPQVISYARYSSTAQHGGTSIARQLEQGEEWARAHGLTIDHTLRDEGISAFRGTNAATGALASILRRIEKHEIREGSTLIVESLDRLSRNAIAEALELFLSIINRGVKIVTLMDKQEYGRGCNLQQLMYSLMILSTAREESVKKSERSKDNWARRREAAKNGQLLSKKLPAWLQLDEKGKLQLVKAKANTVRYIFDLALKGHGIGGIVRKLNAERIGNLTDGGQWYTRTVWSMFSDGAVIGIKHVKKFEGKKRVVVDSIPDYYPAVVSEEVYNRVRTLVDSRRSYTLDGRAMGGKVAKVVNIFKGIIRDEDGYSYTTFCRPARKVQSKNNPKVCNAKEHRYLISVGAFSKRVKAAVYLRQDLFELAFFEVMLTRFPEMFAGKSGDTNGARKLAIAKQAELDRVEKQIADIEEALPTMKNPAVALRTVDKLETQRAAIAGELKSIHTDGELTSADEIDKGLERMRELLTGEADSEARTEVAGIVRQLVKSVTVKVATPNEWLIGECTIEARSGETIAFTFRYPHKAKRATVAELMASLVVECDGERFELAGSEAEREAMAT